MLNLNVRRLVDRASRASTLKLLLVGAICTFAGLILLALTNGMMRRTPTAQAEPAAAAPQVAEAPKIPTRVIMPSDMETTGSIPTNARATPAPARSAAVTQSSELVQPMIGRPSRSARRAERQAQKLRARTGKDLTIVATHNQRRHARWLVTTSAPMSVSEAEALCAELGRKVRCHLASASD